eukprot:GGOE01006365.1.p1 GENE.GGOE01006365.1~~GGOE01006365.1.p1  ORF type:complete len:696 (+),score=135.82 GGOE01006365.1:60-2090(+)
MANAVAPTAVADKCLALPSIAGDCSNASDVAGLLLPVAYLDAGLDVPSLLSARCARCLADSQALSPEGIVSQCLDAPAVTGTCTVWDVAMLVPLLPCAGNATCQKQTQPPLDGPGIDCGRCLLGTAEGDAPTCLSPSAVANGTCNASEVAQLLVLGHSLDGAWFPAMPDGWLRSLSHGCGQCLLAHLSSPQDMVLSCFWALWLPDRSVAVCTPGYCLNAGNCSASSSENTTNHTLNCTCVSGWTGDRCQIRACLEGHCQHGGTCSVRGTTQHCTCPRGWTGNRCQAAVLAANATTADKLAYLTSKYYATDPRRVDDVVRMSSDQRRGLVESLNKTESVRLGGWRKDYVVVGENPDGYSVTLPTSGSTSARSAGLASSLCVTNYGPRVTHMVLTSYDMAQDPFATAGVAPPSLSPGAQYAFLVLADRLTADADVVHVAPFSFTVSATGSGTLLVYSHVCDSSCTTASATWVAEVSAQAGQYAVHVDHTSGLSGMILSPAGAAPISNGSNGGGSDFALLGLLALLALPVLLGVAVLTVKRCRRGASSSPPTQLLTEPMSLPTDGGARQWTHPVGVAEGPLGPGQVPLGPVYAELRDDLPAAHFPSSPHSALPADPAFTEQPHASIELVAAATHQSHSGREPHGQYSQLEEVEVSRPAAALSPHVRFAEGTQYRELDPE